ncbi:FAD-binding protein [Lentzea sp. NBRC 102530]|uniref:FAD-binding oxidoreductase n=1 Tax=Lentzea sp. NBRC 102530 TaxID=3032201 RepID=UPI0024A5A306|nr:FAD-binding protein [Lentzea sp. NBRC 102530]GLY46360.1 FAD-linked oxidase [Lentzea sp. NBRC 102530]
MKDFGGDRAERTTGAGAREAATSGHAGGGGGRVSWRALVAGAGAVATDGGAREAVTSGGHAGGAGGRVSRRALLAGAGAVAAGGLVVPGRAAAAQPTPERAAAAQLAPGSLDAVRAGSPTRIVPGEARYENLLRGNNFRFVGSPDEIRVATSAEQVVRAVDEAVQAGRRVAVRSGGHCFEDFTASAEVRSLIDLTSLNAVGYDERRKAFFVEPGATLGQVYRVLGAGWGVTVPGGGCPEVGAGGHFAGGGYGPLSRRYGAVVDHLHGVEVVVVGRDGRARLVTATREPGDPHRELWWAHTGGGGGNFGVVTRYWLRSPRGGLPPLPRAMVQHVTFWDWGQLSAEKLARLLRNFGEWHERGSAPGDPRTGLYGVLEVKHQAGGIVMLSVQADADLPGIDGLVDELVANVGEGLTPVFDLRKTVPWLHKMTWPGTGEPGDVLTRRYKIKAGYLRKAFTGAQCAALWRNLTKDGGAQGSVLLIGYGGQAGAVQPQDTAIAQRDVVMKAVYQAVWTEEQEDAGNLAWVRGLYRDVYAETGGVPVPNEVNDGSYINYADADLADPLWNTSGTSAQSLYYKENYPRLQRIKAKWDPRNVFRHSLSIQPG